MGFSLLLVDDSSVIRRLIKKELLSALDYEDITITEGANGKEACAACDAGSFDLLVLDLTMPVMTGYEVLEYLKNKGTVITTIVLSADIQPGVDEMVREMGAAGYLHKPFIREQMLKVLRETGFRVKD
ncbi:MAG: response regulator [Candidatus Magnetominusculus sp. LBB02]|nr:response regulator [Candidatus Magnetominusculus sp. LBB02]